MVPTTLGHCSSRTMNETMRQRNIIVKASKHSKYSHFKKSILEKAKIIKRSGNNSKDNDVFIPGQVYQVDLVLVSGPSNLDKISTSAHKLLLLVK